jgi:hypothetical protein
MVERKIVLQFAFSFAKGSSQSLYSKHLENLESPDLKI